jgi:hypothetical protein
VKQLVQLRLEFQDFGRETPRVVDWRGVFETHPALERLELACVRDRGTVDVHQTAVLRRGGAVAFDIDRPLRTDGSIRWEIERVPPRLFADVTGPALDVVVSGPRPTKAQLGALEQLLRTSLGAQFAAISVATR